MTLKTQFIQANGLRFGYFRATPTQGGPLVLVLHGFPDTAHSFVPLLQQLSDAGFDAVAPFMRGYGPTEIPADRDYSARALAQDVIALIDHFGAAKAVVVGHDWGAFAAYAAAALRPDRIQAIVVASVPHPRRLLLRPSGAQLQRSSYMLRFQMRFITQRLQANRCAAIRQRIATWSPKLDVLTALAPVWDNFADPARLEAALGYYRALPGQLFSADFWDFLNRPTPVPALVLHGSRDGCIGPETFSDQEHLFGVTVHQQCIQGAGHFLSWDAPEEFSKAILEFLQSLPTVKVDSSN